MTLTKINSKGIKDGEILNADINASAAIAGTKINPNFGSQQVETTGAIVANNGLTAKTATEPQIVIQDSDTGNTGNAAETSIQYRDGGGSTQGQIGFHDVNSSNLFIDTQTTSQPINCRVGGSATQLLIDNAGIDVTGNITATGKLGIGTTSPNRNLTVSDGTNAIISVQNSGASTEGVFNAPSGGSINLGTTGTHVLTFSINSSEKMRLDTSGKVGIGTSSPTHLLHLESASSPSIKLLDTTVNTNLLLYSQDGNAHIGTYSNHPLAFDTNSTERMRITSDGKVGIGTASPGQLLTLSSASPRVLLTQTTNNSNCFLDYSTAGSLEVSVDDNNVDSNSKFQVRLDGATAGLTLDSTGLGIGTTSPLEPLDIILNTTSRRLLFRHTNSVNTIQSANASSNNESLAIAGDNIRLNTGTGNTGSEAVRIDSSGRVGIGTSSPDKKLEIRQTSAGHDILAINRPDSDTAALTLGNDSSNNGVIASNNSDIVFGRDLSDTFTERMRLTNNGELRIGGTHALDVGTSGTLIPGDGITKIARDCGTGAACAMFFGGSGKVYILGDGDLENTNNRYTGFSDQRLKENIVDANSQWDDIKSLKVRNYNFKESTGYSTHKQIGVIAQELEALGMNGLVKNVEDELYVEGDVLPEGKNIGDVKEEGHKSVAYSVLYMKAIKALQEAMAKIETLETKVAALEAA